MFYYNLRFWVISNSISHLFKSSYSVSFLGLHAHVMFRPTLHVVVVYAQYVIMRGDDNVLCEQFFMVNFVFIMMWCRSPV